MTQLDRLFLELWPPTNTTDELYVILDGAQSDRILRNVRLFAEFDRCCLYEGRLDAEIERVAPYLVRLDRRSRHAKAVVEEGWGQSQGIFFWSGTGLSELRRHFRKFLRVQDEQGKHLLFRYYDPRVWRVYLPTCYISELRYVFGPVRRYLVEAEKPEVILEFSLAEDSLRQWEVRLD